MVEFGGSALGGFLGAAGVGGAIGQAIVMLELDSKKYQAELAAAEGQTKASTSTMAKFGGIAKAGFAVAGLAAVAFAANSIKAASDLGESVNKSNVVFGKNADKIREWADTGAEAFGLSARASLDAAANFGTMLQSAGLATDASANMSQKLVQLSGDLASFNNVDPTIALEKLRSGLAGEAEPLRQFGVFLSEAAVQQEAYSSGIAEVGTELTEAQKIQARYNIVLEQTTKQQGDFQRTADSLPNQLRTMKAEFENVSAAVGTNLLPIVTELLKVVKNLIPLLQAAADHFDVIVVALLGFGAVKFIPGLFISIATGLEAMGAAATAQRITQMAVAVGTLGAGFSAMLALDLAGLAYLINKIATGADPTFADELGHSLAGLAKDAPAFQEAMEGTTKEIDHLAHTTEVAGKTVKNFANMTDDELQKWADSTKESFDSYVLSLEESEDMQADTAAGFKAATNDMLDDARALAHAMRDIAKEKWVNDEYVKFLSEQGPEWLIGFADSTEQQQRRAQTAWEESTKKTDAAKSSLEKITGALDDIGGGRTSHTVQIHYEYTGFNPAMPGMQGNQAR